MTIILFSLCDMLWSSSIYLSLCILFANWFANASKSASFFSVSMLHFDDHLTKNSDNVLIVRI